MNLEMYKRCSDIARGLGKADFVLKNAKIVNVFTGEIIDGDIAVADGMIAGIGRYEGIREKDLNGRYVCPGFIDSHLHLESTLVTPKELISQAVLCGTTAFIVDPHESANVAGMAGIDYILRETEEVPANVFVMMPSCVPATGIDDNACRITADMMAPYLQKERVLGLGEVMDYISVVEGSPEMHQKLKLFEGRVRDGHAPFLQEADLQAYVMAGISTDHECSDFSYAMRERRNGMTVLIREGSAARNLQDIVQGIVKNHVSTDGFCFCTDDKHIEDIKREGHINYNVRKAIALGIRPVHAIQMATIQAARCYGLSHLGAVAPGYQADLLVLDNLEQAEVREVYYKGRRVEEEQVCPVHACPGELKNTVHVKDFTREKLNYTGTFPCHVIQMEEGQITTKDVTAEKICQDDLEGNGEVQKIAVIERHRETGMTGVGFVKGFGLRCGAAASSVSHDSHNIIVIGDNDEDMELAVRELIRTQGGYTLVHRHQVYETLELPIMGLMTDMGFEKANEKLERMILKAHEMGVPQGMDPFIALSFMALPVIPEIRITPRGMYSVTDSRFYR
ncbi:adenine deaminase [Blautia sp.]|uniref:adenine deaminase n=1 Tax=Blautia sp. TaxID=1955243 RepID=UPI00258CCD67|nr:adenine deaminase [Blautia sp.]